MPKLAAPIAQVPLNSDRDMDVVRTTKAIPTIERQAPTPARESESPNNGLPCSGRCGHCDCHPCRLHAPI